MSYPGHSLEESYASAEKQSVYSTAPAEGAIHIFSYLRPYNCVQTNNYN